MTTADLRGATFVSHEGWAWNEESAWSPAPQSGAGQALVGYGEKRPLQLRLLSQPEIALWLRGGLDRVRVARVGYVHERAQNVRGGLQYIRAGPRERD